MKQPLALSHTEGDSVIFRKMVRQQQPIPQVLVISQFPWGTPYVISQPVPVGGRELAGASWAIPFPQSGKASGDKPVNPIFNGSRRVSVDVCRFVRAGSVENIENHMKPVEVSPLTRARYFVLNGGDKCFCICNRYPFHWEHPRISLLPVYPKI
ncbi:MAG: hypothetical protein MUO99_01060 [Dehalococcoidales bacterium]|nr:hypothetical protein [Dehalococcoidales bacterium]